MSMNILRTLQCFIAFTFLPLANAKSTDKEWYEKIVKLGELVEKVERGHLENKEILARQFRVLKIDGLVEDSAAEALALLWKGGRRNVVKKQWWVSENRYTRVVVVVLSLSEPIGAVILEQRYKNYVKNANRFEEKERKLRLHELKVARLIAARISRPHNNKVKTQTQLHSGI